MTIKSITELLALSRAPENAKEKSLQHKTQINSLIRKHSLRSDLCGILNNKLCPPSLELLEAYVLLLTYLDTVDTSTATFQKLHDFFIYSADKFYHARLLGPAIVHIFIVNFLPLVRTLFNHEALNTQLLTSWLDYLIDYSENAANTRLQLLRQANKVLDYFITHEQADYLQNHQLLDNLLHVIGPLAALAEQRLLTPLSISLVFAAFLEDKVISPIFSSTEKEPIPIPPIPEFLAQLKELAKQDNCQFLYIILLEIELYPTYLSNLLSLLTLNNPEPCPITSSEASDNNSEQAKTSLSVQEQRNLQRYFTHALYNQRPLLVQAVIPILHNMFELYPTDAHVVFLNFFPEVQKHLNLENQKNIAEIMLIHTKNETYLDFINEIKEEHPYLAEILQETSLYLASTDFYAHKEKLAKLVPQSSSSTNASNAPPPKNLDNHPIVS